MNRIENLNVVVVVVVYSFQVTIKIDTVIGEV